MTDPLYASLHRKLGEDYDIVKSPGPHTLRLRAAITEAKGPPPAAFRELVIGRKRS